MDITTDVENWLRSMGFDGEIPETLNQICTNSTSVVWDQLIQNTKPIQEVEKIRNNVIIHRLQKKPLNKQDEFSYQIKEISLYIKKQMLETKLKNKQLILAEKQKIATNLAQNNKIQYLMLEILDNKIKQNEEKEYLLERKCELLREDIQQSEELLINNSNLSQPKHLEDTPNIRDITATLQESANKLKEIFLTISHTDGNTSRKHQFFSTKKPNKTSTIFENHITITASKSVRKTTIKEESHLRAQNKPDTLKKRLFAEECDQEPKSDSLGLLPDSYFDKDDDDDSVDFLTKKPHFSSLSCLNLHLPENPKNVIEKLLRDFSVREKLKILLSTHNRHVVWNVLRTLNEQLHLAVTKNVNNQHNNVICNNVHEDNLTKNHMFHIQTELKRMQNNAAIKHMNQQLMKKKEDIKISLSNMGLSEIDIDNSMKLLELLLENVGLDASLSAIKKEIHSAKSYDQNEDLQVVLKKLSQTKINVIKKVDSINHYIRVAESTLQTVISNRNKTLLCVHKLSSFMANMETIEPLIQRFNSQELKIFEDLPLEYNRSCFYTDPSIYYRDMCVDNFPLDEELDSDSLFMISELLNTPFNPPEIILLNILRAKRKLDVLLSLRQRTDSTENQKFSLEEMKQQESYLQYALDRLNFLNCSSASTKTLAVGNNIKTMLEVWHEMPYKDYISTSRLVDGKDYKYYEKQYDNYFNNL